MIFTEECAAFGLTSVQYAALMAVAEHPDVDATRLSSLIAFDRSTLGDVLERLETRGWLVRHPSPSDRRVKLLRLSETGAQLLTDVRPSVLRVQERLVGPLSRREADELMKLLGQLVEAHCGSLPVSAAA